ncbi:MAG TPA: hypothetical protein VK348_10140, partial [Planctomycetota bacterium]|nr:hypothetical protein [Planctomycetota bacterium]
LTGVLLDIVKDQAKKLPAGNQNTRDNLYGILAGFWIAGISGEIITSAAGTAIGGGIGACAAGVGAPPGAAIGFGVGAVVGLPMLITPAVLTVPAVLYIEDNYPVTGGGSGGGCGGGVATLAQAGPMESLFVGMIRSLPHELITLARLWDKTPGLPAAGEKWLAAHRFLQEPLQRVAWVIEHDRMSPNAPTAQDLTAAFSNWIDLPDSEQMQDWYLDTFGLLQSEMRLSKQGLLTLEVPRLLRRAGAPAEIKVDVPDLDFKIGGHGGVLDPYVRATFTPGPAALQWGRATVVKSGEHKDSIKLEWSIAAHSTIGHLKVTWKAGGDEQVMAKLAPKLGKAFSGALFFKPDGLALLPAGFALNGHGIDVDLDLPKALREAADALKDTVGKAVTQAERELEQLFERNLPWAQVWKQLQGAPGKSLLQSLQESPGMFGLARADQLLDMELKNGRLRVKVAGRTLVNQKLPVPSAGIAKLVNDAHAKARPPADAKGPRR